MNIILDYGLGNLRSLQTALSNGGIETVITDDVDVINSAKTIFLPGVGAYRDASNNLWKSGLADVIIEKAREGCFIVGICLGMQLLYDRSFENGDFRGLGLISGEIKKLSIMPKIPHMGWNNLLKTKEDPLTKYIDNGDYVYFVHSYYAVSQGEETIAITQYGEDIPAIVRKENIIGFQFHPEKSSLVGINLIKALKEVII